MGASPTPKRFWTQLLRSIETGRVIPILGQDLLTVPGQGGDERLYSVLARRLADYLGVHDEDLPPGGELNAVACRFREGPQRGNVQEVYPGLEAEYRNPEVPVPDVLKKLAEIEPLQLFVTTTFDDLMQRALDEVRFEGRAKTKVLSYTPRSDVDLPKKLGGPTVFHLLGKLSVVPDFAVTDEDILEFVHSLQSKTSRPELLFDEFDRQQLLLIGSGFPDWLTRFFLRATSDSRLSVAAGTSLVADTAVQTDEDLRGFLRNFSSRTTVFEEAGPIQFVDELHRRWMEHVASKPAAEQAAVSSGPSEPEPGAVFISYASEDREAALAMCEKLKGKVDLWYDKAVLEAGDDYERLIRHYIEDCAVFVALVSEHSLDQRPRFFRHEWNAAIKTAGAFPPGKRFVMPVAIDDVDMNAAEIPDHFRDVNYVSFPGGACDDRFVDVVVAEYRKYQKALHQQT